MVDFDAQIGARTQKVGLLVGFHAKERVTGVEKDCPCGSVHAGGAFELQPGGPSHVRAGHLEGARYMPEAYCVKCKSKREIKNPAQITMKNGRPAVQGECPVCGTKLFKIGASK
jgi:hypothetical protein